MQCVAAKPAPQTPGSAETAEPIFTIIPALQQPDQQVIAEPVIGITVKSISPMRMGDGDLVLRCPSLVELAAGKYTLVNSEIIVSTPCGWRIFVTAPLQLVARNIFFASFVLSPSTSASVALSFNIYNANAKNFHFERGAPLALLTPVAFTKVTASVQVVGQP